MKNGLIGLTLLILFSSLLIFYKFNEIPKNLSFDEVEFGQLAQSLDNKTYAPYSEKATGHSTLYFYIILGSFKIFGINNFGLRFPSALFGFLSVIVFYLIANKIFKNNYFVFISVFTFLSMRWFFNFARFSFETTFLLFLELLSIYCLFKSFDVILNLVQDLKKIPNRVRNDKWLILSAVFAGLVFHSYLPGRIFFLLPLGFIFFQMPKKYAAYFLTTFLIIISPLLIYFSQHRDLRVQDLSLLSAPLSISEKVKILGKNITDTALMFNVKGDSNGRHNYPFKPALNPILGGLFILGFLNSARNFKKNIFDRFFLIYFLISIIPTLLVRGGENPHMLRTFTVIPSIVYFIGLSLKRLSDIFGRKREIVLFSLGVLIVLSSVYEVRTYFLFQSRVARNSFEVKCPLEKVISLKKVPKSCLVRRNEF